MRLIQTRRQENAMSETARVLHESHGLDRGVSVYLAKTFPQECKRQLEYLRYAPIPRATHTDKENYSLILRFRIEHDAPAPMAYIEMREVNRNKEIVDQAEMRIRAHENGNPDSQIDRMLSSIHAELPEPIKRLSDESKVKAATIRAILRERLI